MPKLHAEPLLFCVAWALLAFAAGVMVGWQAGAILSVGLLLVIMPTSTLVLTRLEDFRIERLVRWGILVLAALGFALWVRGI
jgi:hypothetical protein